MDSTRPTGETNPAFDIKDLATLSGRLLQDPKETEAAGEQTPVALGEAKITLRSADRRYANFVREEFTDENGSYSFEFLAPGKYTLQVENPTLESRRSEMIVSTVEIHAAEDAHCDLRITPQRMISGIVYFDKDRDAKFKSNRDTRIAGAQIKVEGHSTVSDAKGSFQLADLPPGRVELLVTSPGRETHTHVVVDLGIGVAKRDVNVPVNQ